MGMCVEMVNCSSWVVSIIETSLYMVSLEKRCKSRSVINKVECNARSTLCTIIHHVRRTAAHNLL